MKQYLSYTIPELFHRLSDLTEELIMVYIEIADMEADEIRERALALQASTQPTVTGRQHDVYMRTSLPAATAVELRAKRDALIEERNFIFKVIAHASDLNEPLSRYS